MVSHEFLVGLHAPLCSHLRLLDYFAEAIGPNPPGGLWLQMDGCINDPCWVHVGFGSSDRMILAQGWKTFSHSQRLEQEQILHLRFNGEDTLFVKIFMYLGGRAAVPRARAAMTMPTP
jgi:hypothetical protein